MDELKKQPFSGRVNPGWKDKMKFSVGEGWDCESWRNMIFVKSEKASWIVEDDTICRLKMTIRPYKEGPDLIFRCSLPLVTDYDFDSIFHYKGSRPLRVFWPTPKLPPFWNAFTPTHFRSLSTESRQLY